MSYENQDIVLNPTVVRVLLYIVGFFGSMIVGIITYFLASLIRELKESDNSMKERLAEIELSIVELKKDVSYLNNNDSE